MKEKWLVLAVLIWAVRCPAKAVEVKPESKWNNTIVEIGEDYQKNIRPIFAVSCFNCHSIATQYPWYYVVPGIKGIIDHDVKEARKHLDMSNGYPFWGPGSLGIQLKEIAYQVDQGNMPPFRYRIMHWDSGLSKKQKEEIEDWTERSLDRLYQVEQ